MFIITMTLIDLGIRIRSAAATASVATRSRADGPIAFAVVSRWRNGLNRRELVPIKIGTANTRAGKLSCVSGGDAVR